MRGLSVLSQKATREQKLLLSFHVLDAEGKGYITKETTTELLRSCLTESKEIDICLSDDQIARIVDSTFEEADLDNNNVVDLQEYQVRRRHMGISWSFCVLSTESLYHYFFRHWTSNILDCLTSSLSTLWVCSTTWNGFIHTP